jgi:iron complex outermembrane receptor protein
MKRLTIFFLLFSFHATSQQADTASQQLSDVTVRAFEQTHKYKDVAAAIGYINRNTLQKFNTNSIVQAINTLPGIRMEERSPGSFRLNIRGSSLRSPFGVRNVKIYYNDIPYTDPGGQSYLNQLGYYNFNSVNIIKGPSGSIYGAGTGGVMLIESMNADYSATASAFSELTFGSFGMKNLYAQIATGGMQRSQFGFQHQQSDGYREHSALRRDVFSYSGNYLLNRSQLKTTFIYGDLKYETPGALNENEYKNNPRASRPAIGSFPSAVQAQTAIMQKMFLAGASLNAYIGHGFANKTVLYGMFTDLRNPNIQNYDHNSEPHTGIRSVFTFKPRMVKNELTFQAGTELQQGFASVSIHKNVNGNADSLRTNDNINNRQALVFTQANYETEGWILTAGASLNFLRIQFERFSPATSGKQIRRFSNNIAPRIAILKKLNALSVYASVSKGFSTPTTTELLPTGGAVNLDLNAEEGVNYEIGLKGNVSQNLFVETTAFYYNLKNAIAQRRTAGGGDYYVNAGSTKQRGIETSLQYLLFRSNPSFGRSMISLSHAWNNFRYKEFKQLTNDYSGNQLPSVPKHTVNAAVDINFKNRLSASANYYRAGKIALNDANSAYANAYNLLGFKCSYQFTTTKNDTFKFAAGADNLLNEQYSLGNDINGFNGRYYNSAPGRNYFVSVSVELKKSN